MLPQLAKLGSVHEGHHVTTSEADPSVLYREHLVVREPPGEPTEDDRRKTHLAGVGRQGEGTARGKVLAATGGTVQLDHGPPYQPRVRRADRAGRPSLEHLGKTFGGTRHHYAAAPKGNRSIARVDARIENSGARAFVALEIAPSPPVVEGDLDLMNGPYLPDMDVNPQIPPEGAISYTFRSESEKIAWQFTAKTKRLRSISIAWGE